MASAASEIKNYDPEFSEFLTNQSIVDSCQDSPRNRSGRGFSNHDCSIYLYRKRIEALEAKQLQPEDCEDQAFYEGYGPLALNMRVSLTGNSDKVVKFQGEVLQGDASQFVVYDSQSNANAIILFGDGIQMFNDVTVGGHVVGYGGVEGSATASLESGRETQIPIIDAYCLQ
jgi:hypothetical protein